MIEWYYTFNTKLCPYELPFGYFYDQPIPPDYYDLLNDNDAYDNNTPDTTVDDVFLENKGVEYAVMPNEFDADYNDEGIDDDTVIDDADSLKSAVEPLQDGIL